MTNREYWDREVAVALLKRASAHVIRQQWAGKHAQDRQDAQELAPELAAFLKRNQ